MKLKPLALSTGILFVVSLLVYINENRRGGDLSAGSYYIKGLDPGKIDKIVLKAGEEIVLARDGDRFVLENRKSHPASPEKVNDFVYKIASIQIKEKKASNVKEEDLSKYELDKSRKYHVELFDNDGKKTVSFKVGKTHKQGNYLVKEGSGEVYLSLNGVWLTSAYKDFIDTRFLSVKSSEIENIRLKTDRAMEISREGDALVVKKPPSEKFDDSKVREYADSLQDIPFEDFYKPSEDRVANLKFDGKLEIRLKNKLVYHIGLARDKKDRFAKISASVDEDKALVVKPTDGEQKIKDIGNILEAQRTAQKTNAERARWIYRLEKAAFEKMARPSKFFLGQ